MVAPAGDQGPVPVGSLSELLYATFLGSYNEEFAASIAVDGAGQAYITGWTYSSDFPAVHGPGYDTIYNGGYGDAFVVKLDPSGTSLAYATFLGGLADDYGMAIAVDGAGQAYITGWTYSSDFPAIHGPGYDTTYNGYGDAFALKLAMKAAISGQVTELSGGPIPGVAISLGEGRSILTGDDGRYTLGGLDSGTYTLTPSKAGYAFSPSRATVNTGAGEANFIGVSEGAPPAPFLDLPFDYSYTTFAQAAEGNRHGKGPGRVNAWFDHAFPLPAATPTSTYLPTPTQTSTQAPYPLPPAATPTRTRTTTGAQGSASTSVPTASSTPSSNGGAREVTLWSGITQIISPPLSDAERNLGLGLWWQDDHEGLDYAYRAGSLEVRAAAAGLVVSTTTECSANCAEGDCAPGCELGNTVVISHEQGYFTQYGHLGTVSVGQGVSVHGGDVIGTMGSSGATRGTSLHFALFRDDGDGVWEGRSADKPVDPYGWAGSEVDPWVSQGGPLSRYLWAQPLGPGEVTIPGESGGLISDTVAGIEALVPGGLFSGPVTVELSRVAPPVPPVGLRTTGRPYWLRLLEGAVAMGPLAGPASLGSPVGSDLSAPITITVHYADADLLHLDPTQLALARWDEEALVWRPLSTTVDEAHRVVTGTSYAFGLFDLQAPLLCPGEPAEPDDSFYAAQLVPPTGTVAVRLFDVPGDEDWFRFRAQAGADYLLETGNLAPGVDTVLELYDSDGLTLLTSDDNGGGGLASRLDWEAPAGGSRFLRLRPGDGSALGCDASYELSVAQISVSELRLDGPTQGPLHVEHLFRASAGPETARTPITYVWESTEQGVVTHTGGLTDTVGFAWDAPGQKAITVTALNEGGMVTGTCTIAVAPAPEGVSISGPTVVGLGRPSVFTARVTPVSATLPVLYRWEATDQSPVEHSGGPSDTVSFAWDTTGAKVIRVTASSYGATVTGTHQVGVHVVEFAWRMLWLRQYGYAAGGWTSQDRHPRMLGDVNGDGKADIVGFSDAGALVSLSTGSNFLTPTLWIRNFGYQAGGWTSQDRYPRMLADVNGDGRADVVGFGRVGVFVALSTGSRFEPPTMWLHDFCFGSGWTSQNLYPRVMGDMNCDGQADVVGFGRYGVLVSYSYGFGFLDPRSSADGFGPSRGGWTSQDRYPRTVANVDGYEWPDLVGFGRWETFVSHCWFQSCDTPVPWTRNYTVRSGEWLSQNLHPRMLADVNGDGGADVVGFGNQGVFVSLSTGSSFASPDLCLRDYALQAGGWASQNLYPRAVADVNGDGRADIVGFGYYGVSVSLCQ